MQRCDVMIKGEKLLRTYDKALRLRYSQESPNVLLERKTFCGRIGSVGPEGLIWLPDIGRRREEGHLLIMQIHRDEFIPGLLLELLKSSDTWKGDVPLWRRVEDADERIKRLKQKRRSDIIRYKSEDLWNKYVWKYRQRVNVPTQIL